MLTLRLHGYSILPSHILPPTDRKSYLQLEETMSLDDSLRQKWLTARFAFVVCACLVVVTSSAYLPQTTVGQDVIRSRSETGDMECISYCSNIRPGIAFIAVRVRVAESPLS